MVVVVVAAIACVGGSTPPLQTPIPKTEVEGNEFEGGGSGPCICDNH